MGGGGGPGLLARGGGGGLGGGGAAAMGFGAFRGAMSSRMRANSVSARVLTWSISRLLASAKALNKPA